MTLRETVHHILSAGTPESFLVLFDYLEERGWPAEAWDHVLEYLTGPGSKARIPYDSLWVGLLGNMARTNYETAVDILTRIDFPKRDYVSESKLVDVINTAHCQNPRNRDTWQHQIEHQKMEQVTGETGGDLGPWPDIRDSEGRVTQRQWATDFAPEWLQHELEREFGYDASFHTVYHGDGGNFGPGFDEALRDEQGVWRPIRQFGAGSEPDCPFRSGAPEDERVLLEQTYCGEHPGKQCSLCEENLGDDHGNIYLGELGGQVFVLDVLADVDLIEIREEGDLWRVVAFAGDLEVDIPETGVGSEGEPFPTGCEDPFDSRAEAEAAVQNLIGALGRRIGVLVVASEGEE